MSGDLDSIFDSVVSDGGDTQVETDIIGRNADVFMGDDEIPVAEDGDGDDLDFDEPGETDEDESESGEESDDSEDIDSDDDATDVEFDFDSFKDKPVKVTVNGETFEVPLAELRNGYMRQADYTRKTQLLAADTEVVRWAKVLQDGFKQNPEQVLSLIHI